MNHTLPSVKISFLSKEPPAAPALPPTAVTQEITAIRPFYQSVNAKVKQLISEGAKAQSMTK